MRAAEHRGTCLKEHNNDGRVEVEGTDLWPLGIPRRTRALEPTPDSVRSAPAAGRGSPRALGSKKQQRSGTADRNGMTETATNIVRSLFWRC